MTESESIEDIFREMLRSFKGHMAERLGPFIGRLDALEKRMPERGEKGADGINGKDGAPGLSIKGDTGDKGEPGKDGKDGASGAKGNDGAAGKDGTPGKAGKDGEPGIPGEKGKDGEKGADGLSGKDGSPGINGKDGHPGIDGQKGIDGINGKDGHPGIDGKNADPEFTKQLIASMLPDHLQKAFEGLTEKMDTSLDLIRREALDYVKALPLASPGKDGKDADPEVLLRMVKDAASLVPAPKDGKDGADAPTLDDLREVIRGEVAIAAKEIPPGRDGRDAAGKDGKDGFGFEDLRVEYDGERSFALVFERGAERKEFPFQMPVILDRGLFEITKTYERGDSVTYGGEMWIAQRKTERGEAPRDSSGAFRQAVKRGRDAPSRGYGKGEEGA